MRCTSTSIGLIALLLSLPLMGCKPPEEAQQEAFISGAGLNTKGKAKPPSPEGAPPQVAPTKAKSAPQKSADSPGEGAPIDPDDPPAPPKDEPLKPGVPEEPAPGDPGVPPPPVGGGGPEDQGPSITLTGRLDFPEYTGGLLQLDVMDGPSQGPTGKQPGVIRLERLDKPGAFTIRLPANAGEIYLTAFNDADENGRPNREDPRAAYEDNPITVGEEDISGVVLTLAFEEIPPPPGQL